MSQTVAAHTSSSMHCRITNALLFAISADCLAGPFADLQLPDVADIDAALHQAAPALRPSHAITQALVLAEHLALTHGHIDHDNLAVALAENYAAHIPLPSRSGSDRVLAAITEGIHWLDAAASRHAHQGSFGNTAAVRAIAAGLLPATRLPTVTDLARHGAAITHSHPLAHDGAAAVAAAITLAARGYPTAGSDPQAFVIAVASQLQHGEFRAALDLTRLLVRHRAGPAEIAAVIGNDNTALRSVPAAITAYLRHPAEPVAAIRLAISIGGNTTAIAAITAALTGAHNPDAELPDGWRRLTYPDRIRGIALNLTVHERQDAVRPTA